MPDAVDSTLVFFVNGKKVVEKNVDPEWTLIHYLRKKLRLTGTKLGCAEGGCGACTVLLSRYDPRKHHVQHYSVNACLYPVCAAHGLAITTVEGIGSTKNLHPIQERLASSHGSQCGFCTPGFVMSMYALMRNHPHPTHQQIESAFEGNLCRCTGYRPILEGMKTFAKPCGMGARCCRNTNGPTNESDVTPMNGVNGCNGTGNGFSNEIGTSNEPMNGDRNSYLPADSTQEAIFPSELRVDEAAYHREPLTFRGPRVTWYTPSSMEQLLRLKAEHPEAKLVNGNTEVGVETKFKNMLYPVLIYPTSVPELTDVVWTDEGVRFGAGVTLTTLDRVAAQTIQEKPAYQTKVLRAVREMLRWFAGHQIRNVSAIGGNITTASPISDLNPLFMAIGCKVQLKNKDGCREVVMDETFFPGYRRTVLLPDEIIVTITVPYTDQDEYFYSYKQAHRREDDISIVNAGMLVRFQPGTSVVRALTLSYGGMAPTTVLARGVAENAPGRSWDESLLCDVCRWLEADLPLDASAPGGSVTYRRTLTTSFFYKFYLSVNRDLHASGIVKQGLEPELDSATRYYQEPPSSSSQIYHQVSPEGYESVGLSMVHSSAYKQVTGEAVYLDDMPAQEGELSLALVFSTRPHARILRVDPSEALAMPGVHAYIDHTDVPGENLQFTLHDDEELFATTEVHCIGQTIGGVVAVDQSTAQRAAKLVRVDYQDLPHVITIEDAIAQESWLSDEMDMIYGDIDAAFADCDVIIEGHQRLRGQEHFYLEPQASVAVPTGEDDCMTMFATSQCVTGLQFSTARCLGLPAHKVQGRVKRVGGAFGGKETRFAVISQPAAVAARKMKCAVRCVLDRDEDMAVTGTRHPFLGKYKVGAKKDGSILAVDMQLYSNGGCSRDLSRSVMEKAMMSFTNAYCFPNVRVRGRVCRTNLPSNTAFRGFGAPQGMLIGEDMMDKVAQRLDIPVDEIRYKHLMVDGDTTHFNNRMAPGSMNLKRCWDDCVMQSGLEERRQRVQKFNSENAWKKRGLSIIPTLFGVGFEWAPLEQNGALVHIYKDGSVLVHHGGVEMGQGLHTKMIQVASQVLQIPASKIHIDETSSAYVPNAPPTAASSSSDMNGGAVLAACEKLVERLAPIRKANPGGSWEAWVFSAFCERISLSAEGHFKTDFEGHDMKANQGKAFNYYTMGVGCSEVEIDCLTGDHKVLSTDIVMDVGNSLNPAIDVGQIEGAFAQGYGLFMLEEPRHSPDGYLYTRGPGMYKLPAAGDIPAHFNVTLLKDVPNPSAIYSSKAIGEPPLFLASSVYFAAKEAIRAERRALAVTPDFPLPSPASAEQIRLACTDRFSKQFEPSADAKSKPAWDVVA